MANFVVKPSVLTARQADQAGEFLRLIPSYDSSTIFPELY